MEQARQAADDAGERWPFEVWLSMLGAMLIGIGGGALALVYFVIVGLEFGGAVSAGLLAMLICIGFAGSAVAMAWRKPAGRVALTALGVGLVPALPLVAATVWAEDGEVGPVWWLVSVVVAVLVVGPAWLPGANRWFAPRGG